MRVTEAATARTFLTDVNRTREHIVRLQSQLASGKRVVRVSDDPQAADKIMRLNAAVSRNEQYQRTIADGQALLETTSSALDSFAGLLMEAKQVVTQARNGSRLDALEVYGERIDHLISEALDVANTQINGRSIFGGTQTLTPPYAFAPDRSAVTMNPAGSTGKIEIPVNDSLSVRVNLDAQEAFEGTSIFDLLIQIRDALKNGQVPTDTQYVSLDDALNHVLSQGGKVGALMQSLEALGAQLEQQRTILLELLSVQQDTDVAETIMQLKHSELMLDAALNTGARIIPKSLLDYLR